MTAEHAVLLVAGGLVAGFVNTVAGGGSVITLPILIEVVDREDRLRAVLPEIDAMVEGGLITLEPVEVIAYRSPGKEKPS